MKTHQFAFIWVRRERKIYNKHILQYHNTTHTLAKLLFILIE